MLTGRQSVRRRLRLRPAGLRRKVPPYARQELVGVEGLDDVVVRSHEKARGPETFDPDTGQEEHRKALAEQLLELAADFVAADSGELDVEDGATAKTVTVTTEATCAGGGGSTVSFSNTPLTDIDVSVDSQVPGGTSSTINCVPSGSAGSGDDISLSLDNLAPGTYTCTIVIDP